MPVLVQRAVDIRRLAVLAAALASALTLAAGARADASTWTDSYSIPVTPGFIACNGETVALSGHVRVVAHSTGDAAGGTHFFVQESFAGVRGVGLESGARYVAVGVNQEHFSGRPGAAFVDTFHRTAHLVAQGALANTLVHVDGRFIRNADGRPTVHFLRVSIECQG